MLKKSMDIIDICVLTSTYQNTLVNCYVDNIYSANYYWFMKINCREEKYLLKLEPGVRIHLSKVEPSVKTIDKLTAFMRKYLKDSKINSFKKHNWERVVFIELSKQNSTHYLITEIIPRGLLLVTDSEFKVMYANQFIALRDRVVKKNTEYRQPPSFSTPPYASEEELIKKLASGVDLVRGIVKGWGLPGYIAEEILYRSGLYSCKNKSTSELDKKDLMNLVETYRRVFNEALSCIKGYLIVKNNTPYLYTLFKPHVFIDMYELSTKEYIDVNELVDTYFTHYERERVVEEEKNRLENTITQLEKTIENQKNIINEYEDKERRLRETYEKLVSNYSLVENILDCVNKVREEKGWESVKSECRGVERIDKNNGLIYIVIDNTTVSLDIRLDPWRNILKYSIEANKYRSIVEKARNYLDELSRKLSELRNQASVLTQSIYKVIKPRYWFEKYHWIITTNGLLAIGGRNADQNESIVKKYLSDRDLFIHADIHGAPVVVLKVNNRNYTDEDIYDAGLITACYSRGWKTGLGYIETYWVYSNQVSKKAPSGEYLSKGSFMIYGKRNYFRVELKLGIGIEEVCDSTYGLYQRVIISRPETISSKTIVYAVLAPGDNDVSKVSRELYGGFSEKLGVSKLSISLDELMHRIPGKSRVLSINRGFQKTITEC